MNNKNRTIIHPRAIIVYDAVSCSLQWLNVLLLVCLGTVKLKGLWPTEGRSLIAVIPDLNSPVAG